MMIKLKSGKIVNRVAWTGGDLPPKNYRNKDYCELRSLFFREQVKDCGGLDLWACTGPHNSSLCRARIFWGRAKHDAWRTLN